MAYRNPNFMVTWYTNSKKIMDGNDFSDQFRKYNTSQRYWLRFKYFYRLRFKFHTTVRMLVVNPITVDNVAALFNHTPVDRASDYMMAPT